MQLPKFTYFQGKTWKRNKAKPRLSGGDYEQLKSAMPTQYLRKSLHQAAHASIFHAHPL